VCREGIKIACSRLAHPVLKKCLTGRDAVSSEREIIPAQSTMCWRLRYAPSLTRSISEVPNAYEACAAFRRASWLKGLGLTLWRRIESAVCPVRPSNTATNLSKASICATVRASRGRLFCFSVWWVASIRVCNLGSSLSAQKARLCAVILDDMCTDSYYSV